MEARRAAQAQRRAAQAQGSGRRATDADADAMTTIVVELAARFGASIRNSFIYRDCPAWYQKDGKPNVAGWNAARLRAFRAIEDGAYTLMPEACDVWTRFNPVSFAYWCAAVKAGDVFSAQYYAGNIPDSASGVAGLAEYGDAWQRQAAALWRTGKRLREIRAAAESILARAGFDGMADGDPVEYATLKADSVCKDAAARGRLARLADEYATLNATWGGLWSALQTPARTQAQADADAAQAEAEAQAAARAARVAQADADAAQVAAQAAQAQADAAAGVASGLEAQAAQADAAAQAATTAQARRKAQAQADAAQAAHRKARAQAQAAQAQADAAQAQAQAAQAYATAQADAAQAAERRAAAAVWDAGDVARAAADAAQG